MAKVSKKTVLNLINLHFDIVSNFVLRISDFAGLGTSTTVENPLQINLFMQNKANFQKSQMDVRLNISRDYENKSDWTLGENKPNSNPNKANVKIGKMNISVATIKDYDNEQRTINNERYSKQTQTKPISNVALLKWVITSEHS